MLSRINDTAAEGWTWRADKIASGSGLALGQAYTRALFGGRARVRADLLGSVKGYWQGEVSLTSRPLGAAGLTFGGRLRQRELPQEDFFGLGPGSAASMYTGYSRETTDVSLVSTLSPVRWLQIEGVAGFQSHEIERGRQAGVPSIGALFPERLAPGQEDARKFLHAGVTAGADRRDIVDAPRRGGWYAASLTHYVPTRGAGSGFSQVEGEIRQYVPVPGTAAHGVAMRGYLMSTIGSAEADIPFFMLPRLGGRSLRGYEVARFTDRHALAFSVEHRWDVHRKIQLVGFLDAGHVSPTLTTLQLDRFRTAVGTGIRYRLRKAAIVRLDVASGQDGVRWHLGFGPSF